MATDSGTPTRADLKPDVSFDVFERLEMRVARVESAARTEGTHKPSRELVLDLGPYGKLTSIGQFALLDEEELLGRLVVCCCNLGKRRMGRYLSEALVMGTLHPETPAGQEQALPLWAHPDAAPGDRVF